MLDSFETLAFTPTSIAGNIILWHGTTADAVPAILREGLLYEPARKWQVTVDNQNGEGPWKPTRKDQKNSVFTSENPTNAMIFAQMRKRYYEAAPGAIIQLPNISQPLVRKLPHAPTRSGTQPALLKITLPYERAKRLITAWDSAQVLLDKVPAEYIAYQAEPNWGLLAKAQAARYNNVNYKIAVLKHAIKVNPPNSTEWDFAKHALGLLQEMDPEDARNPPPYYTGE